MPTLTLQFASLTVTAQRAPLECGDILFDLGRINESQHMAYEALELFGERPPTLQRLVYLHAIKGEPEAARRFLAVLERSLMHRRWARERLRQLNADPMLSGESVVASRRELMVARDFTGKLDLQTMLEQLLDQNPQNRMAFEYLMAFYLARRRVDKLVENLPRLDDFGYCEIPRHYEEAILILANETSQPVVLPGRRIRTESVQRLHRFIDRVRAWQDQPQRAIGARDAMDSDSLLGYYRLDRRTLQTAPLLADKAQLETQPAWSPDGRYLYFASAAKRWTESMTFPAEHVAGIRYDLKRVRYDVETDQWGPVETVLSADQTAKSNLNPRISPMVDSCCSACATTAGLRCTSRKAICIC